MTQPYLICHKVRGQPAFDVAIQLEGSGTLSDPGPWWIVQTSGHRAYPFWQRSLAEIHYGQYDIYSSIPEMPTNIPDHYQTQTQREHKRNLSELTLEDLEI